MHPLTSFGQGPTFSDSGIASQELESLFLYFPAKNHLQKKASLEEINSLLPFLPDNHTFPPKVLPSLIFEIIPRLLDYSQIGHTKAFELLNQNVSAARRYVSHDFPLDEPLETRQLRLVCYTGLLGDPLTEPAIIYFEELIQHGAPNHLADYILDFVAHINKVDPLTNVAPLIGLRLFDQLVSQKLTWEPNHLQRLQNLATQLIEKHPNELTLHPQSIENLWPYLKKALENESDLTHTPTCFFHDYITKNFETFSAPFRAELTGTYESFLAQQLDLSTTIDEISKSLITLSFISSSPTWKSRAQQLIEEDLSNLEDSKIWDTLDQIAQIYQTANPDGFKALKLSTSYALHIVDTKKESAWHQTNLALSDLVIQSLLNNVSKNKNGMRENFLSKTITILSHHNSEFFKNRNSLKKGIAPYINNLTAFCNSRETLRLILTLVKAYNWEEKVSDDRIDLFCKQALHETDMLPFDRQLANDVLELRNKKQLTSISPHLVKLALRMLDEVEAASSSPWWEVLNQIQKSSCPTKEEVKKLVQKGLSYSTGVNAFDDFVSQIPQFFKDSESRTTNLLNLIEDARKEYPTKAYGFIENILKKAPSLVPLSAKDTPEDLPERLFCWILDQEARGSTRFHLADKISSTLGKETLQSYACFWNALIETAIKKLGKQNKATEIKLLQTLKTTLLLLPKPHKIEKSLTTHSSTVPDATHKEMSEVKPTEPTEQVESLTVQNENEAKDSPKPSQESSSPSVTIDSTNLKAILEGLDNTPLDAEKTNSLHAHLLTQIPAKIADSILLEWATSGSMNANKEQVSHRFCSHLKDLKEHEALYQELLTRMISFTQQLILTNETSFDDLKISNKLLIDNKPLFIRSLDGPMSCYRVCKWIFSQFIISRGFEKEQRQELIAQLDQLLRPVMAQLYEHNKDDKMKNSITEIKKLFATDKISIADNNPATDKISWIIPIERALALYADDIFSSKDSFIRYKPFKGLLALWLPLEGKNILIREALLSEGNHLLEGLEDDSNLEAVNKFLKKFVEKAKFLLSGDGQDAIDKKHNACKAYLLFCMLWYKLNNQKTYQKEADEYLKKIDCAVPKIYKKDFKDIYEGAVTKSEIEILWKNSLPILFTDEKAEMAKKILINTHQQYKGQNNKQLHEEVLLSKLSELDCNSIVSQKSFQSIMELWGYLLINLIERERHNKQDIERLIDYTSLFLKNTFKARTKKTEFHSTYLEIITNFIQRLKLSGLWRQKKVNLSGMIVLCMQTLACEVLTENEYVLGKQALQEVEDAKMEMQKLFTYLDAEYKKRAVSSGKETTVKRQFSKRSRK